MENLCTSPISSYHTSPILSPRLVRPLSVVSLVKPTFVSRPSSRSPSSSSLISAFPGRNAAALLQSHVSASPIQVGNDDTDEQQREHQSTTSGKSRPADCIDDPNQIIGGTASIETSYSPESLPFPMAHLEPAPPRPLSPALSVLSSSSSNASFYSTQDLPTASILDSMNNGLLPSTVPKTIRPPPGLPPPPGFSMLDPDLPHIYPHARPRADSAIDLNTSPSGPLDPTGLDNTTVDILEGNPWLVRAVLYLYDCYCYDWMMISDPLRRMWGVEASSADVLGILQGYGRVRRVDWWD